MENSTIRTAQSWTYDKLENKKHWIESGASLKGWYKSIPYHEILLDMKRAKDKRYSFYKETRLNLPK